MKFCKGMILGLVVGASVSAVVVASNSKLAGNVKQKSGEFKKQLSKFLGKIKQKLDNECSNCGCAKKEETNVEQNGEQAGQA